MARITSYPVLSTVSSGDWIPITDTSVTGNPLKNVTVGDLQSFIVTGSTLQTVVTAGNTYQGSSGPLWTWAGNGILSAASSSLSTALSERSFRSTNLIDSSYTQIRPALIAMGSASGNKTELVPNLSLVSDVSLRFPLASGTLALTTDIPTSPWVPVAGGIAYPGGGFSQSRVGINTAVPQEALDVTGHVMVSGKIEATDFYGELRGTISSDTTGTTQASTDDSTKIATTAFVTNAVGAIPSGLTFQGDWDALNNVPNIGASTPDNGDFYIVSVAGTTNLGGITDWEVGDWAIAVVSGGVTTWQKIDNSSVLTGTGTGTKIAKWSGTGTSVTLESSAIEEEISLLNPFNSNIGINSVPDPNASIYNGYSTGNIAETIGIKNKAANANTNAAINADVYGIISDATSAQTVGFAGDTQAIKLNARHEGASSVAFVVGSNAKATIANGGSLTAGNVYGNYATAEATGTNTSNSKYQIGNFVSSVIDNPNHTAVNFIGAYVNTDPEKGTAGEMVVLQVNSQNAGGSFNLTGDLTYLKITPGTMGAIGGTARAIHSEVTLPSLLLGSLESTGFIKTGGAATEFLMADGTVTSGSFTGNIPQNQITFGNATSDGITSSSSLAFNDTSKELFIGGTSAFGSAKIMEDKLQIEFNANLRAALQFRNSSPEIYFKKGSVGTFLQVTTEPTQENFIALPDKSGTVALLDDVVGSVTGTGNAGYIPLWLSATGLTDSAIFQNGTSVGIGTIAPAAQLETTENILVKGMTIGVGTFFPPPQISGGHTVVGVDALPATTGARNTAIGHSALKASTTGGTNTAIGSQAMEFSTVVTNATAVGAFALQNGIGAYGSVAIGAEALRYSTLGTGTVALGSSAGKKDSTNANNTRADQSVFIGTDTKPLGINQTQQIVIGSGAVGLGSNTAVLGSATITKTRLHGNVGIGTDTPGAQIETTEGILVQEMNISAPPSTLAAQSKNTAVGYQAMVNNTTGIENTAIGYQALVSNQSGDSNIAIGKSTLIFNVQGDNNIAIGTSTLSGSTSSDQSVAIGTGALRYNNVDGSVAVGYEALTSNTTGQANTAVGTQALSLNTTGDLNTSVGKAANYSLTTGSSNTSLGFQAGYNTTTASGNTYIGKEAGGSNFGSQNVAVGSDAISNLSSGNGNVALGYEAGDKISDGTPNTTSTDSIFIGKGASPSALSQTNEIVIGADAIGLGSNTAIIGTNTLTETRLHGNINVANGDVDISIGQGVILRSPDGTKYRITVDNSGALGTEEVT